MKAKRLSLAALLSLSLVACGGGDGGSSDNTPTNPGDPPTAAFDPRLTKIDPSLVITPTEAQGWFEKKNGWGPTYTGSPAWKSFMAFLEERLVEYGAQGLHKHKFPYERWYTSEYPDKSGWSLVSDGTPVEVASYATQSGSTGPMGVTAPMVLYDMTLPAAQRPPLSALAGKIVVVKQAPFTGSGTTGGYTDYEFRTDPDTFLEPGVFVDPTYEGGYRNRNQFGAMGSVITGVLKPSGAVGHIAVLDMPPGAAQGGRQHGTPSRYEVPGLLLDKKNGAKVIEDARAGKTATLKLDAKVETNATAFQLIATLPGRDYGTARDKAVFMATHTDGPGLIQDSGGLGILGVIKYFSQIPQSQRPMSIYVYLDCRHFVAGAERGVPYDYIHDNLETLSRYIVGGVAMEHSGGAQMHDVGDRYEPTGRAMTTYINTYGNDLLVEKAIEAVKGANLPRAQVNVNDRPGVHGQPQNSWLGRNFATYLDEFGGRPVWHVTGDWPSSGYQAFYPGINRFRSDVFIAQVETAIQLVGTVMTSDLVALNPDWGKLGSALIGLKDDDFKSPGSATAQRQALQGKHKEIFDLVRAGTYEKVPALLDALSAAVTAQLIQASAGSIDELIASAKSRVPAT